jgi:DNA-binding NarL/FixJ family response regulator
VNPSINVVLVDDHAVVREGYRRLLAESGQIHVVAEAANGAEGYQAFCRCAPDVVVMDISLPGGSGIGAMTQMLAREPKARVLMFSMHQDSIFVTRAMSAGARGYVTKSTAPSLLVEAVLAVAGGRTYVSADVASVLRTPRCTNEETALQSLSTREFEVLRLQLQGKTADDIAHALNLSRKSVANHHWMIKQKLGVENSVQLMRVAMRLGLLREEDRPDAAPAP